MLRLQVNISPCTRYYLIFAFCYSFVTFVGFVKHFATAIAIVKGGIAKAKLLRGDNLVTTLPTTMNRGKGVCVFFRILNPNRQLAINRTK